MVIIQYQQFFIDDACAFSRKRTIPISTEQRYNLLVFPYEHSFCIESLDEFEKKSLQAISEQDEEVSATSHPNDSQSRDNMKEKIDELFKEIGPYDKDKLIMLPDTISEKVDGPVISQREESKSEAALPAEQNVESKQPQVVSPRRNYDSIFCSLSALFLSIVSRAVEQLAMEKAVFKEGEEETKKRTKLTDLIESSANQQIPTEFTKGIDELLNEDDQKSDEARDSITVLDAGI